MYKYFLRKLLLTAESMQIEENIKTRLEALEQSPAFAMSRGGRELFHTNFLAFILEQKTSDSNKEVYIQRIKAALLKRFFSTENLPNNVLVLREKMNLDLLIIPTDHIDSDTESNTLENTAENKKPTKAIDAKIDIVVIEAKLKSIPRLDQLQNYSEKLENKISIDLYTSEDASKKLHITKEKRNKDGTTIEVNTLQYVEKDINESLRTITYKFNRISYKCFLLAPETLLSGICNYEPWSKIDWSTLFGVLLNVYPQTDDKMSVFVRDYIESTIDLLALINQSIEYTKRYVGQNMEEATLSALLQYSCGNRFRNLRIHDVIGKVVYEFFGRAIFNNLINEIPGLSFTAFFTNSTPGFQIEFVKKIDIGKNKEIGWGVQLQGTDYRHYVRRSYVDPNSTLETLAKDDKNTHSWFSSNGCLGLKNANTEFKRFGEFLYMSKKVGDCTHETLCNEFKKSLKNLKYPS